ncbi:MAG: CBS domain-containing protein [Chloroflexi bacterium]|jgi:CBS domain-containing protein/anti-sigma regulatory factor (Ser/Thr protein kinase)|nr:CBS domain-containing protein [Anaerolineaceae bacterium]NLI45044.1 CBS domain-containing protein [Chloroflexota bacterium]HOE34513.1 CBS domain-containing protein [Anaerolineaceae bacterium]HOT25073.1 CBS domain-containing protein [Anaerolineaceae bacterium]HQK03496.1 CBS domain-containing protein [Anaerolineaceae bacterium]
MVSDKPLITDDEAAKITRVEELAYELTVGEVMTKKVFALRPEQTMREALDEFKKFRISGAPVAIDGNLCGILSIEDLIRSLRDGRIDLTVADYMTSNVITVKQEDQVIEALKLFVKWNLGRLPVLDSSNKLVGILTKGDITNGLLKALQKDFEAEELIRYRASHLFEDIVSDRSTLTLRYNVKKNDFSRGGAASNNIKKALLRLGASPQVARRCGIAVYEAEMNLIIHTNHGGVLRVEIEPDRITMEAYDDGPGIPDISLAMKPGYSTAPPEIRAMGFGAGMGLVNIKSCVDEMNLSSSLDRGTNLYMVMHLDKSKPLA